VRPREAPPVAEALTRARNPAPGPILVVGLGAIGSLVGGRLHRAGVPVALVGRGEHFEAVCRSGLILEEGAGREPGEAVHPSGTPLRPPAFSSVRGAFEAAGSPSLVILTMKTFDVAGAAAELARVLEAAAGSPHDTGAVRPAVLCLQNGLGAEEAAAEHLGRDAVLGGVITLSVARPAPGRVRLLTGHGGIALGPLEPAGPAGGAAAAEALQGTRRAAEHAARVLRRAGFRVVVHDRASPIKWSKVLLNLWANAGAAAFDALPEDIVEDPVLFHVEWAAFREALAVMRRAGHRPVDLPGYPVRLLVGLAHLLPEPLFRRIVGPRVVGGRGGKVPSLLGDLEAGRSRTEAPFINGAVAAAARRLGLEAPVNRALADAVEARASGRACPWPCRGRPHDVTCQGGTLNSEEPTT